MSSGHVLGVGLMEVAVHDNDLARDWGEICLQVQSRIGCTPS